MQKNAYIKTMEIGTNNEIRKVVSEDVTEVKRAQTNAPVTPAAPVPEDQADTHLLKK